MHQFIDKRGLSIPFIVISTIGLIYYITKKENKNDDPELIRKDIIERRKHLVKPQEKYASLKVDRHFVNPFDDWKIVPFYKTALFWMNRWKGNGIPCEEELVKAMPVIKPDLKFIFDKDVKSNSNKFTFTWFGQSTCLITIDGLTILTDPVFSKCSINDYLGPKRLRPIPCKLEDIKDKVDIVIVSHDHFDHLDEAAVRKLGNTVTWYIPLGLKHWFLKRNIHTVKELDWWQEIQHHARPDITIACVPAMHWSGSRTPFEKNNTLWCSYVIKSRNDSIFFCGDTGYTSELFKAIGELYAPFTLALIPIGSFEPFQLMSHLHMGPDDAVKAHIDLKSPATSVGIHWGTFMMSDEHYLKPRQKLMECFESTDESRFITTFLGDTLLLN